MKEEFRLSLSICEEIIAGKVNVYNDSRDIILKILRIESIAKCFIYINISYYLGNMGKIV